MVARSFNILSLCTGAGGLDLGVHMASEDARTVCYVEIEAFACELLASRAEEGWLDDAPIWSNLRTFDSKPWRGVVDCIIGGYPCQPFSDAGKRRGEDDPRHLWPVIRNIVADLEPAVCFFENVRGHLRRGLEKVRGDLHELGYRVAAGCFTAEECGAPQRRERLFIMAHAEGYHGRGGEREEEAGARPDGERGRRPSVGRTRMAWPPGPEDLESWRGVETSSQPAVRGVADGLAPRVDRLRALGNGVVPVVAAYAWRRLETALFRGEEVA